MDKEPAAAYTPEQEALLAKRAKAQELLAQDFDSLNLDEKLWLINAKLDDFGGIFRQLATMANMMGGKPQDVASQLLDGVL